jgi:uncharacterized membrane protein YjgN (DUF898 family)
MTSQDIPAATPAAHIAQAEAAAAASVRPPPPAKPTGPVRFTGDAKAFWRLLLRGALLLAVTLGIYRFWLATDVRRFLWSHTEVAGENLEYNGTTAELLIGFLIAIAILVPINLGFFVLALSLGSAGEFVSTLGFPALFVLGQFAVYRARRYRLTRTVLRGIRFQQTGSGVRYAFCATFWWIMFMSTLGLTYPFMQANLERYKMRHTFYGDLGGRFEGSGWRLFGRGVFLWLMVVAPLLVGIVGALGSLDFDALNEAIEGSQRAMTRFMLSSSTQAAITYASVGIGSSILAALLLFPVFQAMVWRWWLDGIRFGELTVRSHLLKRRIYGAYLRFFGLALVLILGTAVVGFIGLAIFGASPGGTGTEIAGTLATVALYVVVMLGFSTLYQATVRLTLWRHGVESLEIGRLDVLERVTATGAAGSPVGEGLADALNVGGF